jgi:hypothetical protein
LSACCVAKRQARAAASTRDRGCRESGDSEVEHEQERCYRGETAVGVVELMGELASVARREHQPEHSHVYVDHYNRRRPHRALELRPPELDERRQRSPEGKIRRRDQLGGLIHEYERQAA